MEEEVRTSCAALPQVLCPHDTYTLQCDRKTSFTCQNPPKKSSTNEYKEAHIHTSDPEPMFCVCSCNLSKLLICCGMQIKSWAVSTFEHWVIS